jgi:hypothetical protein
LLQLVLHLPKVLFPLDHVYSFLDSKQFAFTLRNYDSAFALKGMVQEQIHPQRKPRTEKVIEAIVRHQKEKALKQFREEIPDQRNVPARCQESSQSKTSANSRPITKRNIHQIIRSISNEQFMDGLLILAPDQNVALSELLFSTCDEHDLSQFFTFFPTEN